MVPIPIAEQGVQKSVLELFLGRSQPLLGYLHLASFYSSLVSEKLLTFLVGYLLLFPVD